jgi:hypothetical protein
MNPIMIPLKVEGKKVVIANDKKMIKTLISDKKREGFKHLRTIDKKIYCEVHFIKEI